MKISDPLVLLPPLSDDPVYIWAWVYDPADWWFWIPEVFNDSDPEPFEDGGIDRGDDAE